MAEIVLSVLLPVVFEKLASAALNKFAARSKQVQSQLKKLETSLPQIEALLNDAAEKEIQDKRVKDWLKRLQHLAYDIDDVLDSLATDDAIHRELTEKPAAAAGGITRKVRKIIPSCCTTTFSSSSSSTEMHDKLNDITTKLQELYDEKNNLGLTVKDKRSKNINSRYQGSLLPPGIDIVGREGEKEFLLQKLLLADHYPCDQNNFRIVPIVGMGGLGKTTLARLLYNEPKVQEHFEIKAWVCVSDEFDCFNISKVIYQSAGGEKNDFADLNLLQVDLKKQLAGKRFLIVLDDVWSECKDEDWDKLVPPFQEVAPGSKIIITTRKTQLLQKLGHGNPYHLNKLSHEDALSLFAQHSLGATNFDSYPMLRQYGEGIVQKCDGLPLALKALGSLLRSKTNEEKWKELLESEIWSLKERDGILPALRLSYLDLSAYLKQLFAYTCLFPKDYVFDKEDLILLWMAEGFLLESSTSKSMECLGEEYFDEFLSRSFFQQVPNDESLFMMHDLMNDLATSVAGEFFIRLDMDMVKDIREQTLEKYRHMSFVREEFLTFKKFKAFERANSLRTFLAVPVVVRDDGRELFYLSHRILVDMLPRLPLLRALCLSNLQIDEIPESVGDLKHLRYLNVSQTPITHLPDNVCNLYNLQTLIIFGCDNLSKLPDRFSNLKNLRHLDIRDTPLLKNMPLGISEMKSLQTLSKIVIGGENEFPIYGLRNLKNLRRRVCIDGLEKLQNNDHAPDVNLSQMKLSELVLGWSDVFDGSRNQRLEKEVLDVLKPHRENLKNLEIMSYGGTEFPKWVGDSSFRKLNVVKMYRCRNCGFLPPLGQLPSLKRLSIEDMDEVKEVGSELLGNGPSAFPSLEILRFDKMPRWEVWSINAVGIAVFPCLKKLRIDNCPNMVRWEIWSANANVAVFSCLEKLWIEKCPKLVEVSVEAIPSLRVLNVSNCGEGVLKSVVGVASSSVTKFRIVGIWGLSDEVWGGVVQSLGALEGLFIWNCEKLVRIGGGGGEKEEEGEGNNLLLPTSLRMLQISGCENLKHLSCPANSIEELEIRGCSSITSISFPTGGVWEKEEEGSNPRLTSLRMLDISDCENLKHLSCPVNSIEELSIEGCSSITSVSFPTGEGGGGGGGWEKLKSLKIDNCNSQVLEEELEKQLLLNNNNTNIPSVLRELKIWNSQYLNSITKFTSSFIQLTRLVIGDCRRIESSFPNLQNLASLKHLEVTNCPNMDGPPLVSVGVWPPKLESLEIGKLKRPISEWGPLPNSLVELQLWGGFGSSSSSVEEEDVKSFPTSSSSLLPSSLSSSLTKLRLSGFKKMERISSEGLQHLTSLQHLQIWECPKLKELPETLLPSLLSLFILGCGYEELKEKMMKKKSTRGNSSYWPLLSHIPQVYISRY